MLSNSSDIAVSIENVSKLFTKQNQKTFKELLPALFSGAKASERFIALKNVDFNIKKGESVGIIGPNGSGKSTLLKLIAGVSDPTKGRLKVNGKVAPLIELGAGFHPELSGRENVFLNGVILGMTRDEIKKKFKSIVDFAELWDFIDQPVKHYSSGMYLRLAFAVAIHTDPEILLVDEILAVGDQKFQEKCLKKINEIKQEKTVILVSHDQNLISLFANRVIVLEKGVVVADTDPKNAYLKLFSRQTSKINRKKVDHIGIISSKLSNLTNKDAKEFFLGDKISLEIIISSEKKVSNLNLGVSIKDYITGSEIFATNTDLSQTPIKPFRGKKRIEYIFGTDLLTGKFTLDIGLFKNYADETIEFIQSAHSFRILHNKSNIKKLESGLVNIQHKWKL